MDPVGKGAARTLAEFSALQKMEHSVWCSDAGPIPGIVGWVHQLPPLLCDVKKHSKERNRTGKLQAGHPSAPGGTGHGQFKHRGVDYRQFQNKIVFGRDAVQFVFSQIKIAPFLKSFSKSKRALEFFYYIAVIYGSSPADIYITT